MRQALKHNGLSILFLTLFLASLGGHAIAGHRLYNEEAVSHAALLHEQAQTISFWRYVTSSSFGAAVTENWQSEYLQFVTFILATVWLVQRGSTESKLPADVGLESERKQQLGRYAKRDSPQLAKGQGIARRLYENSLLTVMALFWIGSWTAQSLTGWSAYNAELSDHEQHPVGYLRYLGSASFWEATLQNWQSEFLAVGSMVVLTVYLRQRGSQQSKPVGAPHDATAEEG